MAYEVCEGCGESIPIGGGISAIWSFAPDPTGGMTLEFPGGVEVFLCFPCIDQLPEEATEDDVKMLIESS